MAADDDRFLQVDRAEAICPAGELSRPGCVVEPNWLPMDFGRKGRKAGELEYTAMDRPERVEVAVEQRSGHRWWRQKRFLSP
ncbi:MAG TPA: hypothetical protein VGU01_14665 [Sphingomicrobium sp.]|nr:hypothetical protein [Sphingomicrobium sp.]